MFNFRGDAIDLDSFCGNIISECEKTEEVLMNTWFPEIATIFTQNNQKPKADKLQHFYNCASSLLSIQVCAISSITSDVMQNLPQYKMILTLVQECQNCISFFSFAV